MTSTRLMVSVVCVAHAGFRLAKIGLFSLAMIAHLACVAATPSSGAASTTALESPVSLRAAMAAPDLIHVEYLSAARAGRRLVAVGERGTIALSDDDGMTFRQAKSVPVQTTLTGVTFADAKTGWAVGHWGTVLITSDGGETWALQRHDLTVDQPLFSVHFANRLDGVAVGLWSLLLVTHDGGEHWSNVKLPAMANAEKGDVNLYHAFGDGSGGWFVTAERGIVWHSSDRGVSWQAKTTGYAGSLWAGVVLQNGSIVVGGLRGAIYVSRDGGVSWTAGNTNTKSSITGLMELTGGAVLGLALDGVRVNSSDGGRTFVATQVPTRSAFTAAVLDSRGSIVFFTAEGILGSQR